jgi:hypothetical protein
MARRTSIRCDECEGGVRRIVATLAVWADSADSYSFSLVKPPAK